MNSTEVGKILYEETVRMGLEQKQITVPEVKYWNFLEEETKKFYIDMGAFVISIAPRLCRIDNEFLSQTIGEVVGLEEHRNKKIDYTVFRDLVPMIVKRKALIISDDRPEEETLNPENKE